MDRTRAAEVELRRGPSPTGASRSPEVDGDKALSHSCCICGKTFPFQSSLSQHMRKHTGEKPYKCPYCDHRASQKGNLKIHVRSHRTGSLTQGREPEAGELRASEGLDGCTSPTKSTSACNKILNGAAPVDDSKILLRSSKKEAEGAASAPDEGKAAAQCSFCKCKFERKKDLEQHVHQAHKPFRCRLCSYMTVREESLLSHIEKDHITAQGPSGAEAYVENGKPELTPGEFPCEVCGQAFSQTWFLKAHMKKHRGSFDHGCHICGRRFKEPWFLKNHMKAHGPKTGSKNKPRSEPDPIATINNVVQEEMIVAGLSLYEVCTKCGNLFTNLDSLNAHNAIHRRVEAGRSRAPAGEGAVRGGAPDPQQLFLRCLNLRPAVAGAPARGQAGRRVAELDPVNSYQAWQLATRGKVAEPAEYLKYGAWEEALAGQCWFRRSDMQRDLELVLQGWRGQKVGAPRAGPAREHVASPLPPGCDGTLVPRPPSSPRRGASARKDPGSASVACFSCGVVGESRHSGVKLKSHRRGRSSRLSPEERGANRVVREVLLGEGEEPGLGGQWLWACGKPTPPGDGRAGEGRKEGRKEGIDSDPPGGKPLHFRFSEEAASTALASGDQGSAPRTAASHTDTGEPGAGSAASASALGSRSRDASKRAEQPRFSVGVKMPAFHPKQEVAVSRDAADSPFHSGADLPRSSTGPAQPLKEKPSDLHMREHAAGGRRGPAPDLAPLDLSERSRRDDPSRKEPVSSLRAALAVHPCPYCDHKTYYPEVLWMHERVWHRVSCSSVAPQWIQPNGYRSIRNNLVFLARSGRTGPPPALGGKECQPLPIARFTRTQVPGGVPGPKGGPSPLGVATKAASLPKSKDSHSGGPCALWVAGPDGPRQAKAGHGPEPHGAPAPPSLPKPGPEAGPRAGPVAGGGGFSRCATPTPPVIARAGAQPPTGSRPGDKYVLPPTGASLGPPQKHSAPDPPKAKFSPQPQGPPHGKGDGGPPLPPREPHSKAGQELRPPTSCGAGPRGSSAVQASKPEPAADGREKRLDILSVFKTYIPKDFASLYQSWGASGPALEHRG
uniref:Zinc finger protein 516 n=1 Tax=Mustela putorius furo TaxID=9669 RepID=M3YYX5_MUSPF